MIQGFIFPSPGVFSALQGRAYTSYSTINLNNTSYIQTGTLNPTITPVDAPESSLYLRYTGSGGIVYIKNDSGSSTNWSALAVSGAAYSFSTIQTDAGTFPVADLASDTLTLSSSDGSVTITGNSSTDTVDFKAVSGNPIEYAFNGGL